jgi:hypothetical protein
MYLPTCRQLFQTVNLEGFGENLTYQCRLEQFRRCRSGTLESMLFQISGAPPWFDWHTLDQQYKHVVQEDTLPVMGIHAPPDRKCIRVRQKGLP